MRRLAVGGRDRGHGEWASDGCGRGHSGGRRVWWAQDFSGSLEERWEKDGEGVICGRERLSERGPEMKERGTSRGRRGVGLQTLQMPVSSRSGTAGEQVAGW